ncbi:MAG: sigma-70 family RNA polymerase sigma factor [Bacteroidales bacterium]|nr:sigma-70 family RNA polymerase sigma factor [Bacteroidales bacterium]
MSDRKIIHLIREGKESIALKKLYKIFPAVMSYVINNNGTEQDAEDIFQEALAIFLTKVLEDHFILKSSISTYLFGICKNLNYEKNRKLKKKIDFENNFLSDEDLKTIEEYHNQEEKYKELDKALLTSGKKCEELLELYYHHKLSMKQIAKLLGYANEKSAKTQKYKCIEKLRKLFSEKKFNF